MLSFDFPEILLLLTVVAVVALSLAALRETSQRPERDFGERGRSFYVVLLVLGLLLPPLGVLTLLRYQLDVRAVAHPTRRSSPASGSLGAGRGGERSPLKPG